MNDEYYNDTDSRIKRQKEDYMNYLHKEDNETFMNINAFY